MKATSSRRNRHAAEPAELLGELLAVDRLSSADRRDMFSLMRTYYENMDRALFNSDLDEKNWVIRIVDAATGALCGFSTQMLLDVVVGGESVRALFSGDTIVDQRYRSHNPLARLWGRLAMSLIDAHETGELYWFLISKGYKTYRFLPVFFHQFYPRFDAPTPARSKDVIAALGRCRYPAAFDPRAGIIRSGANGCRLRPGAADLTARRLRDPHIRFFSERNPGHARGDELCCLAPLTRENFTAAAHRVIGTRPVVRS